MSINTSAVTIVTTTDGQSLRVPFGGGLEAPDADNLYCHQWDDGLFYKHPQAPESGFSGAVVPKRMYLARLAGLSDREAVEAVKLSDNEIRVVEDCVRMCLASAVVPFLWGPFGHAKTSFVESFESQRDDADRYFASASIEIAKTDATAFDGLYFVDPADLVMKRSLPETAAFILSVYRETGRVTVLLFDEMTLASPGQQNAALRALTHLEMGGVRLRGYVAAVVAANPKGTVTKGLNGLGEQVLNRAAHFPWFMSHELWYERWSRGFVPDGESRQPDREPLGTEKAFVRALFANNPEGVAPFESSWKSKGGKKPWSRDNLVPYESLEMSPRSLTDFLRVRRTLLAVCAELGVQEAIQQHYSVFLAKAMIGPVWSQSVLNVVLEEADMFGGFDEIAERLEPVDFQDTALPEGYAAELLYKRNGEPLSSAEQVAPVLTDASGVIDSGGSDAYQRTRALVVMWSVLEATAITDPAFVSTAVMEIADAVVYLSNHPELREGMPEKMTPSFVSEGNKQQVNEEIRNRAEREASHV